MRALLTRRDKWKLVFLLGLMLLGSILEAAGIGAIPAFITLITKPSVLMENRWVGEWFSNLPNEPSVPLMLWASCAMFGFIVFKNIFLTAVFYVQVRIVAFQWVRLGDRMFRAYQTAPYEWYLQRSSSELLRNIQNDTNQIVYGIFMPLLNLIMALIMAGFIIVVMVLNLSPIASLSLIVTGGGLWAVIRGFQSQLRSIGEVSRRESKKMITAIQQGFGAFVDARIIGCEHHLSKIFRDSMELNAKAQCKRGTIQKINPYALETLAILSLLIILLLLIQSTDSLETILPIISLLGVALIRLKQMASQIATAVNTMNAARAFIPSIVNDIHKLNAIATKRRAKSSDGQIINTFHSLRLVTVTYFYPNTDTPAVRDISLELPRGESIAFVGATGCGKSTLVNLILGLFEPQTGQITVNGTDIYQDIKGWRKHIGYIPQSIYLIDDTIQANVAFGVPENEANKEHLWRALRSACLEEFVMAQPNGLNTIVGERGVRLSGGQRQRVGIARALYQNPKVLVMDEATSALDNKTEENVMQAIQNIKQGRTLIMVAHRLSTVKNCDRLYFFREGQLLDVGTYDELNRNSVAFQEISMAYSD
ncbi:ABC transporter ATP-binding protein [Desulfococcaceae bacterium HSG7]|nr:ABC transporter ATP-binding protein [Desulfococcaceae bacterium HSG7]